MPEAENQGVSEAVASDAEANKQAARSMLEAGSTIEEVMASTGLGRNQILGLKGSMVKANKRSIKVSGEPSDSLGKADQEEATLVNDLRDEAKLDGAALIAARNRNRLKREGPEIYGQLHGGQQLEANSPGKILADLELAKYIKQMREQEAGHSNNGDSQAISELKKQVDDLKEERHKKDLEDLKGEIAEMRQDMRHSTNSNSDLAVVVKEASSILEKLVTSDGPLRAYLMPDTTITVKPRNDAPELLRAQPVETRLFETLKAHGLTTHIIERRPS